MANNIVNFFDAGRDPAIVEIIGINIVNLIKNFIFNEDGVTAIEYALIAALVSAVLVAAVTTMSGGFTVVFDRIKASLT